MCEFGAAQGALALGKWAHGPMQAPETEQVPTMVGHWFVELLAAYGTPPGFRAQWVVHSFAARIDVD